MFLQLNLIQLYYGLRLYISKTSLCDVMSEASPPYSLDFSLDYLDNFAKFFNWFINKDQPTKANQIKQQSIVVVTNYAQSPVEGGGTAI